MGHYAELCPGLHCRPRCRTHWDINTHTPAAGFSHSSLLPAEMERSIHTGIKWVNSANTTLRTVSASVLCVHLVIIHMCSCRSAPGSEAAWDRWLFSRTDSSDFAVYTETSVTQCVKGRGWISVFQLRASLTPLSDSCILQCRKSCSSFINIQPRGQRTRRGRQKNTTAGDRENSSSLGGKVGSGEKHLMGLEKKTIQPCTKLLKCFLDDCDLAEENSSSTSSLEAERQQKHQLHKWSNSVVWFFFFQL